MIRSVQEAAPAPRPGDAQRALLDAADAIVAAWRNDPLVKIALEERRGNGVHPDHLPHMARVAARAAALTGSPDTGEGDTP